MTSSGVQLFGYALALIGVLGSVVATTMVEWKRHSYTENTITSKEIYLGLWSSCTVDVTRNTMCATYKSIFHQPAEILATRVVMILSIMLSAIGLLLATLGVKCTHCLEPDEKAKSRVAVVGGVFFIIAAVLALSVTSWFANTVVKSFEFSESYIPSYDRFEFGNAVLVSWGAAFCSLVGGCLLACQLPGICREGPVTVSHPRVDGFARHHSDYV
ncbi:claudin-1 [Esox lucius]|uniref:Claudin n=1 Tax=Esox lucius TaxID=8010 RepID=A0A3P8YD07_ESOLU|nr:claudin-1 [Esox lucius]